MTLWIAVSGLVLTALWALVSRITLGLPEPWVAALQEATHKQYSEFIRPLKNGFFYDVPNNHMPTEVTLLLFAAAFLIVVVLMWRLEKETKASAAAMGMVFMFAAVFRLVLLPSVPVHENDIYRYLWDGKTMNHGINPYKYAPDDLFMVQHGLTEDYYDNERDVTIKARAFSPQDRREVQRLMDLRDAHETYFFRIGHRQVPTIYPPVAELVFAVSSWLKPDSILVMKTIFVVFDLGVMVLTALLLAHFGVNPALVIVYGWSPLVLKEFANSGHYDALPVFFMMLALLLFVKRKEGRSMMALALAALSKFFPLVLLAVWIKCVRLWHINLVLLLGAAFYLPFFFWGGAGPERVFEGLRTYNEQWAYNAGVFALIHQGFIRIVPTLEGNLFPAKAAAGVLCLLVYARLAWASRPEDMRDLMHRSFLAIAVLLIVNPVGDPWYFCWILPLLCLFRYRSWILLTGLLMMSYINFQAEHGFVFWKFWGISVVSWAIYTPFFAALIFEHWWIRRSPAYARRIGRSGFLENGEEECKDSESLPTE